MEKLRNLIGLYTNPKGELIRNTMAFGTLMALAPTIALLSIGSLIVLKDTLHLQANLATVIPEQFVNALVAVGVHTANGGFIPFLIFIGISIYTASRSFYTTILAFHVFDKAKPNRLWVTIQSIIATILFVLLVVLVLGLRMTLNLLFPYLPFLVDVIISIGMFHIIGAAFLLLTSSPIKPYREIKYGAWVFSLGIAVMGSLFLTYVTNFTNYQDVYGSIAGLLILLLSMYWMSCLVYFSFCVNEWIRIEKTKKNQPLNEVGDSI